MPQPYKGTRIRATVRLSAPVALAAAQEAASRRWSMSEYISWCVERQLRPLGLRPPEPVVKPLLPQHGAEQVFVP